MTHADRILLMRDGVVVADGPPSAVIADEERWIACNLRLTSLLRANARWHPAEGRLLDAETLARHLVASERRRLPERKRRAADSRPMGGQSPGWRDCMTATSMERNRNPLWEVTSRTIVYAAIGAALYGILLVAQIPIPGSTVVASGRHSPWCRSSATRSGRSSASSRVSSATRSATRSPAGAALTSWNWSIANGLVGLIAGLAPLYLARWVNGSLRDRAIGGAIAGSIGVVIGFLFVFTDAILQGIDVGTILTTLTSRSSSAT